MRSATFRYTHLPGCRAASDAKDGAAITFEGTSKYPLKVPFPHISEENRTLSKKKYTFSYQKPFFVEPELFSNFGNRTS